MKTYRILFAALIIFSFSQCTSNEEETVVKTPEKVLMTFAQMFPNAVDVEWEMEDENTWEAEFVSDEKNIESEFSADGTWLETETEIKKVDVPKIVTESILAKYPKSEWRGFEEVRSKDFLAYEVEIIYQGEEVKLLVTGSGQILENEEEDKDEEEDEIEA